MNKSGKVKDDADKEQNTENSIEAWGWGFRSQGLRSFFLPWGLSRRLLLFGCSRSLWWLSGGEVKANSTLICWLRSDDSTILDWTVSPVEIHLSGSKISVFSDFFCEEGTNEINSEVSGSSLVVERGNKSLVARKILILVEVKSSILVHAISTNECVHADGRIREIVLADCEVGALQLGRPVSQAHPETNAGLIGPRWDVVILKDQRGIEEVLQEFHVFIRLILDRVLACILGRHLKYLAPLSLLLTFLSFAFLQKPSR